MMQCTLDLARSRWWQRIDRRWRTQTPSWRSFRNKWRRSSSSLKSATRRCRPSWKRPNSAGSKKRSAWVLAADLVLGLGLATAVRASAPETAEAPDLVLEWEEDLAVVVREGLQTSSSSSWQSPRRRFHRHRRRLRWKAWTEFRRRRRPRALGLHRRRRRE